MALLDETIAYTQTRTNRPPSNPARVLHIVHRMRAGGAQTVVMNLYRKMARDQVQFDFVVRTQHQDHYDAEIQQLGGRIFRLPWRAGNPKSIVDFSNLLGGLLRQEGPFAAVHIHTGLYAGHYLPVLKRTGVHNRIVHAHSTSTDLNHWYHHPWQWAMKRQISRYATHRFACSKPAGQWLFGAGWESKAHSRVLPNAIDLTQYEQLPTVKSASRNAIGVPVDALVVGHIGRLDAVKNHRFLLKVFGKLHQFAPQSHLVLVGEGELRAHLTEQAQQLGIQEAVHFLGARGDIPYVLNAFDIMVMPSHYEGLGLALIEAQAAGIPCIASAPIPRETDMGMGMIQYESLQSNEAVWVEQILKQLKTPAADWQRRKVHLQRAGYDIEVTSQELQKLYVTMATQ